jgi:hypothetical protein
MNMVKIKEVILNELHTMKNYVVLDDGHKVDIGKSDSEALTKFFDGQAATFQKFFPNVQHNIPANIVPKSNVICKGPVIKDTMPYYSQVKDFELKADVHYDSTGDHLVISYDGLTATFDV